MTEAGSGPTAASTSGSSTPAGGRTGSPRAPTPSTRSRSSRWRPSAWPGPAGCSTWAAARARSPGWRPRVGAAVVGRRPDVGAGVEARRARAAGRPTPGAGADALPFRDGGLRRGRRLPGVRAHPRRRRRHRRGGPGARAGRPVRLLPEPPAAPDARTAAGSTTRSSTRPSSTGGSGRTSSRTRRSRRSRRACSCRSSTARCRRYVNALAGDGLRHRPHGGAGAARRASWPGPPSTRRRRPSRGCLPFLTAQGAAASMSEFVVITGLSGAGRSQAADDLEDLGLVRHRQPARRASSPRSSSCAGAGLDASGGWRSCVGTGARTRTTSLPMLDAAAVGRRPGADPVPRGGDRRAGPPLREHPPAPPAVGGDGEHLAEAIERERELLEPVKAGPTWWSTPATSTSTSCAPRRRACSATASETAMRLNVVSFGYKHGLPLDVDLVLDCRFLPNPHWVEELRPQTGLDSRCATTCSTARRRSSSSAASTTWSSQLLPAYVAEGKAYLTVAFGCTGGRHRSVAVSRGGRPPPPQATATGRASSTGTSRSEPSGRARVRPERPAPPTGPGGRVGRTPVGRGRRHRRRPRAGRHDPGDAALRRVRHRGGHHGRRRRVDRPPAGGDAGPAGAGRHPAVPGGDGGARRRRGPAARRLRLPVPGHRPGGPPAGEPGARGPRSPATSPPPWRRPPARSASTRRWARWCRPPPNPSTSWPAPRRGPRWRGSRPCRGPRACTSSGSSAPARPAGRRPPPRPCSTPWPRPTRSCSGRSLYSSVLSAVAVDDVRDAVAGSPGEVVYVCNLRAEVAETQGYDVAGHVDALARHGVMPDVVVVQAGAYPPCALDPGCRSSKPTSPAPTAWRTTPTSSRPSCRRSCPERRRASAAFGRRGRRRGAVAVAGVVAAARPRRVRGPRTPTRSAAAAIAMARRTRLGAGPSPPTCAVTGGWASNGVAVAAAMAGAVRRGRGVAGEPDRRGGGHLFGRWG